MPADATLKPSASTFGRPDRLIAFFGIEMGEIWNSGLGAVDHNITWFYAGDKTIVTELHDRTGAEPGYAKIYIPQTPGVAWEAAGSLAFRSDTLLYRILKRGAFVNISRSTPSGLILPEWSGTLSLNSHERDVQTEGIVVVAKDMRDEVRDVKIVGRYQINPKDPNLYSQILPSGAEFVMKPAHFNPGGRPNCILTSYGIPVFSSSPDEGIPDDGEPADPDNEAEAQLRACDWTLGNALKYLQYWYTPGVYAASQWKWLYKLPESIEWPETLGSQVDDEARMNFDNAVGQVNFNLGAHRKGRDFCIEGMYVLEAVQSLLQTSGGWTLGYEPHYEQDDA